MRVLTRLSVTLPPLRASRVTGKLVSSSTQVSSEGDIEMKTIIRKPGFMQQSIAVVLSMALLPFGQWDLLAQPPQPPPQSYMPLDAEQLNQLVAPIALYPDALIAQILTASTYPEQVMEANDWAHRTNLPPQQSAAAADGMPWDPSVKALTAFPTVLETMARNNGW